MKLPRPAPHEDAARINSSGPRLLQLLHVIPLRRTASVGAPYLSGRPDDLRLEGEAGRTR